jgi:hypothetical protein
VRGALCDFDSLRPSLRGTPSDHERLRAAMTRYPRALLAAAGAAAGGVAVVLSLLDPAIWLRGEAADWWSASVLWFAARNFANWWFVVRGMGLELALGSAFSRLGDELASVDLLDRSAVAPFGRRALRNVLLWMLLTAFLSLNYVGQGWAGAALPLALACLGGFALTAFALPLLGARRRIQAAKRAELERVRAAIRAARERLLAEPAEASPAGGRMADLVAWEARVEAVREWPLDASIVARLALYLAIGLGSWIGAALVERLLDTALA